MHEQADLLNGVGDVRPSEGKVLKCTSKTPVMCGVREEIAVGGGEFGASVNGCGNGFTIEHLSAVKNLQSVLLLAKKEAGCGWGDIDAQEMM